MNTSEKSCPQRPVIYQLLPRLFTNYNSTNVPGGTIEQNGSGKLADINGHILRSIRQLGATHVWLTGVIEHAHCPDYTAYGITRDNPHVVKGQAGSPYAISDYYDIDPDLAVSVPDRMKEFEATVDRIHRAGMKVIIDFVPNHVARRYRSDARPKGAPADLGADDRTDYFFYRDNNFYYLPGQAFAPQGVDLGQGEGAYHEFPAKATGNDCFSASPSRNDWYETVKLNYGVDYSDHSCHFSPTPSTWTKMLDILLFWAAKGVDAFRCDMAFMVPVDFWRWAIPLVKAEFPDVQFIAEIYDVNLYHQFINDTGFDYLYDKVNLYDTLRAVQTSGQSASSLTGCWQRLGDMGPHMLNFLENHDEQRYASDFYAGKADTVTPSLVVAATIGTGALMIYAGQELGERGMDAEGFSGRDGRTTIFDYWSVGTLRRWLGSGRPSSRNLDQMQQWLRRRYQLILNMVNHEPALRCGEFFDLMYVNYDNPAFDPSRQFAYLRAIPGGELMLIAVNFSPEAVMTEIRIPQHAFDFLQLHAGKYQAEDLLTGFQKTCHLFPDLTFSTEIRGSDAVIYRLTPTK